MVRRTKTPGTWETVEPGIMRRWGKKVPGAFTYYIRYRITLSGGREREFRVAVGTKLNIARRELAERKLAIELGTHVELYENRKEPSPPFSAFAAEYLEWAKGPSGKRSWERDNTSLKPLEKFFGNRPLDEISHLDIRRYIRQRREQVSKVTGAPITGATANRELACLSRIYRLAADRGKVPFDMNPARGVPRFKENKERWTVLTHDDVTALLEGCDAHFRPLVVAALATGMRPGELKRLQWRDVDFEHGELWVLKSKSGRPRSVPINALLRPELKRLKKDARCGFVFTKRDGTRWKDYRKAWRRARKAAGLPLTLRFYDLRHTAASWMLSSGEHPFVVQEILGHESIEMTRRYSHVDAGLKRKAVDALRWDKVVKIPVKRDAASTGRGDVSTDE